MLQDIFFFSSFLYVFLLFTAARTDYNTVQRVSGSSAAVADGVIQDTDQLRSHHLSLCFLL